MICGGLLESRHVCENVHTQLLLSHIVHVCILTNLLNLHIISWPMNLGVYSIPIGCSKHYCVKDRIFPWEGPWVFEFQILFWVELSSPLVGTCCWSVCCCRSYAILWFRRRFAALLINRSIQKYLQCSQWVSTKFRWVQFFIFYTMRLKIHALVKAVELTSAFDKSIMGVVY